MKPRYLFFWVPVLIIGTVGLAGESKEVNELNKSLLQAVADGDIGTVKSLLSQGAEVGTADSSGKTSLHIASGAGHKEIVELLLVHGADVNAGAYYIRTAAEFAMNSGHTEIVELLISKGADISPLHLALYMKNEAKARSLIEGGADVNKRTPYGTTPLDRAVNANLRDIVRLLLDGGADVNAKDNWDWTPLHSSIYSSKDMAELKAMVELLMAHGANVNAKDGAGRTPLWYAEKEGYTDILKLLLPVGSKINRKDDFGQTALHHAAINGWEDSSQILLDRGAEINSQDKEAMTPLYHAAGEGHEQVVEILLGRGAHVDVSDVYGRTAMHCAAVKGHTNIVKLLLAKGAQVESTDAAGRTPLHYACGAGSLNWAQGIGYPDVAQLLLANGSLVNYPDKYGWTSLHFAVSQGNKAMVDFLLAKGADLNATNERGHTPLSLARLIVSLPAASSERISKYSAIIQCLHPETRTYYVASDGKDTNPGTLDRPFGSLSAAVSAAEPGDTICMRGGTYHFTGNIHISKSGKQGKPIRLWGYPGESPVLDFSEVKGHGILITGAYWHLKGLTITKADLLGLRLETEGAHHNILEQVAGYNNGLAGIALLKGAAYNLVLNCDSHHNFDPLTNGQNADGFTISFGIGDGNLFAGCRAWNNSDDGFDFDRAGASVRLEYCYVWRNGMNIWNHPCFTGNGSGFKLFDAGHILIRCAAWNHHGHGFNRGRTTHTAFLKNCTALRDNINYSFRGAAGTEQDVLINNLSCSAGKYIHPDVKDQFNSWNTPPGIEITEDDLLSLDDTTITGPRNPDGSIPESDFLGLAPGSEAIDAGMDIGLPFAGKAPDLGAFEYDPDKAKRQSGIKWLHQAVRDHDMAKIQSMLSEKADVNEKDWLGYAPLHWACYFGYPDVAELLLDSKANPNLLSDTGRTPMEIAKVMEHTELGALLRKHGAKE